MLLMYSSNSRNFRN